MAFLLPWLGLRNPRAKRGPTAASARKPPSGQAFFTDPAIDRAGATDAV
jgi:hypothetical protein